MPVTNRDASLTTARRRQVSLYGWRLGTNYPANPTTVKAEQAPSMGNKHTGPTAEVPPSAFLGAQLVGQTPGACPCGQFTYQGYDKKSPASC